MDSLAGAAISALWLGILTSINPCPLATNVTAISFLSRHVQKSYLVLLASLIYTLGRTFTYLALSIFIMVGLSSVPAISHFLQTSINQYMGPLLIIVGMFLLDLIKFSWPGSSSADGGTQRLQNFAAKRTLLGAGLLGFVFALSFCPVSAALFFGSLLSLCIKHQSPVFLPVFYGIGTALPVIFFGILIATSTHLVGKAFNILTSIDKWARILTGLVFICAGIYFCLIYIFEI